MIQFYSYKNCSTCQKTKKALLQNGADFEEICIIDNPPDKALLEKILASGTYTLKQLFNRSGQLYREMNMKEKVDKLAQTELLEILASHGKLVKRPIVVKGDKYLVGYDERIINQLCV
ncbi:MAG: Spx/MgsR family RNA polymerase-binding regulatory protein [Candidatus Omnitrophica bacterium]|nr:Spx/MgsR family RNA polymerase-binding regulatory protein [Candidatus Omnitrophota bacterium]